MPKIQWFKQIAQNNVFTLTPFLIVDTLLSYHYALGVALFIA